MSPLHRHISLMFTSALRNVFRRSSLVLRTLATPKKESSRVEITKPATHPDFTGYTNTVQFRQHAEPFLCYRCDSEPNICLICLLRECASSSVLRAAGS
jgi:hypothetical protein